MKKQKLEKIRGKELYFKTWDEYDEYCEGKDIQLCKIEIEEKISRGEYDRRYKVIKPLPFFWNE